MILRRIRLKNWKNFRRAEIDLVKINYVLGPNASGKSNLLDALRFVRDIGKPNGGGLQQAVKLRGGLPKIRCLHHRKDNEVSIELEFSESFDKEVTAWSYRLAFKSETSGKRRLVVTGERVLQDGKLVLDRPNEDDEEDSLLLTETHLEQSLANRDFRPITEFISGIRYLHLVPQLLKYSDQIGGALMETDPFGQSFLESIASAPDKQRLTRLGRINRALSAAVPQLQELRFVRDERSGRPHLEARYDHWRPNAGWQREDEFSDGTLRLIGLLWLLQEGAGMLLLEEPELSLDEGVVQQLPLLFERVLRQVERSSRQRRTRQRQVLISTHSEALLRNEGIDPTGVVIIEMTAEGSLVRSPNEEEGAQLEAGFPVADAVLPSVHPSRATQLPLAF